MQNDQSFDFRRAHTNGTTAVFDKIYTRPVPDDINDPQFGRQTNEFIGQDSGDVFAMMRTGYNFDGVQNPVVIRKDDPVVGNPILSVSNFYGAHGYDPNISNMSAIFFAAGPDIGRGTLRQIQTVDVAPTILKLLGVEAPATVDGKALAVRLPKNLLTGLRDQLNALVGGGPRNATPLQKSGRRVEWCDRQQCVAGWFTLAQQRRHGVRRGRDRGA